MEEYKNHNNTRDSIVQAKAERDRLSNVYGDTAEATRSELSREISAYEAEAASARSARSDLNEQYPDEAADEIEYNIHNFYKEKLDQMKAEYNELDKMLEDPSAQYGEDYTS